MQLNPVTHFEYAFIIRYYNAARRKPDKYKELLWKQYTASPIGAPV